MISDAAHDAQHCDLPDTYVSRFPYKYRCAIGRFCHDGAYGGFVGERDQRRRRREESLIFSLPGGLGFDLSLVPSTPTNCSIRPTGWWPSSWCDPSDPAHGPISRSVVFPPTLSRKGRNPRYHPERCGNKSVHTGQSRYFFRFNSLVLVAPSSGMSGKLRVS
jgi:hypothetical protein